MGRSGPPPLSDGSSVPDSSKSSEFDSEFEFRLCLGRGSLSLSSSWDEVEARSSSRGPPSDPSAPGVAPLNERSLTGVDALEFNENFKIKRSGT